MCCIIETATSDDSPSPSIRVVDRKSRTTMTTVPRPPSFIYTSRAPSSSRHSRHSSYHSSYYSHRNPSFPSSSSERTSYTTVTRTHSRTRSHSIAPVERTSVEYIEPGAYERRRKREYHYERDRYGRGSGEVRILRID